MKKILSICAGLILSIGMAFATDEVTVNPLTIVQGESGELEIVFSAEGEYKGFQFDIAAPAGVTADVNEDGTIVAETGDSLKGFSVSSRHLASGADRFIVTSFVGNQFTADVSILKVTYTTDADLEPGEYTGTISGIKFTTAALQTEKYDDVNFMVTVVEKTNEPGDTIYSEGADIDHWTKTDYEGVTPNGDFHLNTWSTEGETDGTNMLKPFLEYWVWSGNGTLSPATIAHKKITGIAPGLYTASLRVRAYNEGSTNTPTGARITANGQSKELSEGSAFTYNGMAGVYADYSFLIEVGADSTIDLAFDLYDPNFNWVAFKDVNIVYTGTYPEVTALALNSIALNAEVKAAYETALADYQSAPSIAGYAAYQAAEAAVKNSINAYGALAYELATVVALKAHTDMTADSVAAQYSEAYFSGTINDSDIAAAVAEIHSALKQSALTQTEAGSDMSVAFEEVTNSAEGWTQTFTGEESNGIFQLNTWSSEGLSDGTNMIVPFLESWIAKGSLLSPQKISYTITGLQPGEYTIGLSARAYNEGNTNTPTGAYIYAGDATGDSIQSGIEIEYNGMAGVYAYYGVTGTVGADGILEVGFNLDDPNFNWIAIKNLTVVYGGVPEVHTTVIDVAYDRLVNQGYAAEEVAYDEDAVKAALGIENLSAATLAIVDVTTGVYHEYPADYSSDGWLNSDGDATTWGSGSYVCLKVPSDGSMTLCTMPSNEPAEGSAFNAKWAFYTATDTAILNVTINFVSAPAVEAEVVATIEINHDEAEKTAYSGTYETVDVDAVCAALGITSIDEAEYRVAFPNEEEGGYTYESVTTDGWRNAETGAQLGWGNAGGICVKVWADNDQTAGNVTYIGCYDDTHEAGEAYTFYYAFIANNKSVIYKVNINFVGTATAIDGIANGEAAPKGVYNINGQKLSGLQKGLNIVDGKKVLVK